MTRYIVAKDESEAWVRWTCRLYFRDLSLAREMAAERTEATGHTYLVFRVEQKTTVEEV